MAKLNSALASAIGQKDINQALTREQQILLFNQASAETKAWAGVPSAKSVDWALIQPFFNKIWAKIFGDNILLQSVANFLFMVFLQSAPLAEKAVLNWLERKTGIPATEIDEVFITRLNNYLALNENAVTEFVSDIKKAIAGIKTNIFVRIWKAIKGLFNIS